MGAVKVKAVGFLDMLKYFKGKYPPAALEAVIAGLDAADRNELFIKPVLPVSWIDYGSLLRFLAAADRGLGQGDFTLMEAAETYATEVAFKGIWKLFLALATPEFALKNTAAFMRNYFDHCDASTEWRGKNSAVIKLTGIENMPPLHEHDFLLSLRQIFRLVGVPNARITHPKCYATGADGCYLDIVWD